jgi:hypothetical protein
MVSNGAMGRKMVPSRAATDAGISILAGAAASRASSAPAGAARLDRSKTDNAATIIKTNAPHPERSVIS